MIKNFFDFTTTSRKENSDFLTSKIYFVVKKITSYPTLFPYFQYFNRNRRKGFSQRAQLIFGSRHAELFSVSPCFQGVAGQARNDGVWVVLRVALLGQTRRFAPTRGYLCCTL